MSLTTPDRETATRPRAAWAGLVAALLLAAAGMAVPAITGWDVHVRYFPPLHAEWDPRLGLGTLPAIVMAFLAVRWSVDLAVRLSWGRLLVASYAAGLGWMVTLALVDGLGGIGDVLDHPYEYLQTARATADLPATLAEYVSRIPYSAEPDNWPVHVAGHPPGALSFFVLLDRVGLGGGLAAGLVVTLLAATAAVAVLVTVRALGAEDAARRAAPFLVFGPAAAWQCVSGDAMFAAVAAWGMAALAVAATRAQRRLGGRRRAVARLLRDVLLRTAAAGLPRRRGPVRSAVVAATGSGQPWRRWRSCWPTSRSATRGGRRCRCCASATGMASPTTGRRSTGCGATSPLSRSAPGRWLSLGRRSRCHVG